MPRGDRTGPSGSGPMTGRVAGFCAGFDRPGYMNPQGGRGTGMGRGGGRGMGRGLGRGFGRYSGASGQYIPADTVPGNEVLTSPPTTEGSVITAPGSLDQLQKDISSIAASIEKIQTRIDALENSEPSEK